jgi:diaminopimelate epimerase
MGMLRLVKYQGLGNDFLIALDGESLDDAARKASRAFAGTGADPVGEMAQALCDRHAGPGADGLVVFRSPGTDAAARMELRNADGSRAETSGNGLRCFALALIDAGVAPGSEVVIETDVGIRRAVVLARTGAGSAEVSVEMGTVHVLRSDPVADAALPGSRALPWPAWSVDAGNPHLVLLAPSLEGVALTAIGPLLEARRPGGQNVELTTYDPVASELSLIVWERGAGVTLACGSGSVAAAAALHSAGIAPGRVRVHNPGGTAVVSLFGHDLASQAAELAGAVHRVACIELEPGELAQSRKDVAAS